MMRTRILSAAVFAALALGPLVGCGDDATSPDPTLSEIFSSRIQPQGSAWRTFQVTKAGTVTLQLSALSEAEKTVRIGFGTVDGTQCALSSSVDTVPNSTAQSPQITTSLSTGTYCVSIADIGNITRIVDFTLLISRQF
jgi:hypothetical protein